MNEYVVSKLIHFEIFPELNGSVALNIISGRRCFFKGNISAVRELMALQEGRISHTEDWWNANFPEIIPTGILESTSELQTDAYVSGKIDELRQQIMRTKVVKLGLLLNTGCSRHCSYCSKRFAQYQATTMTPEKIEAFFALMERPEFKYVQTIRLTGGEFFESPYCQEFMNQYLNKAADKNIEILTNGTKVPSWFLDLLPNPKIYLAISYDGLAHHQNRGYRPDNVISLLRKLREKEVEFSLNVGITPESLGYSADEFATDLADKAGRKGLVEFFIPLFTKYDDEFYQRACDFIIELQRKLESYGVAVARPSLDSRFPKSCGNRGEVLFFDGERLLNCDTPYGDKCYIDMHELNGIALQRLFPLRDRSPIFMEQCQICPWRFFCNGGCAASANHLSGNDCAPNPTECWFLRTQARERLRMELLRI